MLGTDCEECWHESGHGLVESCPCSPDTDQNIAQHQNTVQLAVHMKTNRKNLNVST